MLECDTLDDIPDQLCTPALVDELVFTRLRTFVGPVFTGPASPVYTNSSSAPNWGREIRLNPHETLQMRIYPRGVLSAGKLLDINTTVFVATRRQVVGAMKDQVAFALLWHPQQDALMSDCQYPFNPLKDTSQPVIHTLSYM